MIQTWITAYDVFSARVAEYSKIDTILVGDSLGMTVYGDEDTTQVTKETMRRHFLAVQKGAPKTKIVLDFPFECDKNLETALQTAEYFSKVGAQIFKIEGNADEKTLEIFKTLLQKGFQIVAHLGLQPQKFLKKNWKVQGQKNEESAIILNSVQKFYTLGIREIVLECIPEKLSQMLCQKFPEILFIGIGAGRNLPAQILVFDDIVGRTDLENFSPKFVKIFGNAEKQEITAVQKYISEVKSQKFPEQKHVF